MHPTLRFIQNFNQLFVPFSFSQLISVTVRLCFVLIGFANKIIYQYLRLIGDRRLIRIVKCPRYRHTVRVWCTVNSRVACDTNRYKRSAARLDVPGCFQLSGSDFSLCVVITIV